MFYASENRTTGANKNMENNKSQLTPKISFTLKDISWTVTLFLILNPILSILLLVLYCTLSPSYLLTFAVDQFISISIFSLIFAILTNLSITMGYHRLYAHKSFEAHPLLEWFLLFISSGAFQGSALKWASDHRIHHRFEDTERDPYSIKRGFWYAHMGWMMLNESVSIPINAPDLEKNKLVQFQHKYYLACAIFVGYFIPTIVGWFLGNALLGLVIAGGLRIFLTQQSTFFVNSLSHMIGKSYYSVEKTAKDSLIVAILTHGEGYHNYHHKFQIDYRNGIKWYHWDPTKWSIQFASLLGLAKRLRTVPFSEILRAKLETEVINLKNSPLFKEKLEPLYNKIIANQARIEKLKNECALLKNRYWLKMNEHSREQMVTNVHTSSLEIDISSLRVELKLIEIELKYLLKSWNVLVRTSSTFTTTIN